MAAATTRLTKRRTGIPGLDEVTRGGLPDGGAVLVVGRAGSGKTVLCLQILAGATVSEDNVAFVSFEESKAQIERAAMSFNWGEALLGSAGWHLISARPPLNARAAGDFDLEGLKAAISSRFDDGGGSWVVLDGIDRLLRLHPDVSAAIDQIVDLSAWCEARRITLLLTAKRLDDRDGALAHMEGVEFMLDTVLGLFSEVASGRLNRRFRIEKYRGSGHAVDELPMMMDDNGLHLPYAQIPSDTVSPVTSERLSTGIPRLDSVLDGGLYRGSSTLISGQPGTAKTTLAGSIAEAAAGRGERVLYLSFDELADRIVRNLSSVGVELERHRRSGQLHLHSRDAWRSLIEEHYIAIHRLLDEIEPDWLIIDPISALLKAVSVEKADIAAERLFSVARARGITTVMTSLSESDAPERETTLSHTSTLADSWISLAYNVKAGERNRALSVVKSRGSAHSNQVRELLLHKDGVDLAEIYRFGTEVLMGTARLQKESEQAEDERRRTAERRQRRKSLEAEIDKAHQRLDNAEREVRQLEDELERVRRADDDADSQAGRYFDNIRRQRESGDRSGKPDDTAPNEGGHR